MWSPSRTSPLFSSQSHGCVWMALILGEGWLTLWQYFVLLWFGGLFCFGGCFGKTVYKLIFVVLVFKAKKKKPHLLVTALRPVDGAVPTYEDAAAWKGLCGGFPFAVCKPTLSPALCFLHQTAWWNTCTWVVHFRGVQGSLDTPLRFSV